ncbi:MAG: 1-deoxy-D-xylulose-5-phosphate reductoisomerase [Chitinophagaceae bacterium]
MKNTLFSQKIAIFGSTGSIGCQALEVLQEHKQDFQLAAISGYNNIDLLIQQALKFLPNTVVIGKSSDYSKVKRQLPSNIKILVGEKALCDVAKEEDYDMLLAAIVGSVGLSSTYEALERGKTVALANKESLVVAGELMMEAKRRGGATLIPVDSEHSAILQCLQGESENAIEKIILTASGGPFRGKKRNFLEQVRALHAMEHPVWKMGKKITIDSSSLMNKGLEVIEAKWLFNLNLNQIEVVIHPQSIIHSLVEFMDGSLKAQMSTPDMRLAIQYAFSYPDRIASPYHKKINLIAQERLSFEAVDHHTFPCLNIAYNALRKGGNAPCIMNKANEILVEAFLKNQIRFYDISDQILNAMEKIAIIKKPTMEELLATEKETEMFVNSQIKVNKNL